MTSKRGPQDSAGRLIPRAPLYSGAATTDYPASLSHEVGAAIERARDASDNRFCFLEQQVSFGELVRWHDAELSHLWRYHLHYFDYVRDLLVWAAVSERKPAYEAFRRLTLSWIEGNRLISGDGWHPYTISLRVVNWFHAFSFFAKELEADQATADLMLRSAHGQVSILASDLELDVRGNHLLENLRALIWSGLAFEGAEPQRWLETGMRLLESEVAEQVLSDGGHFERSPGYQLVVFRDLLEISLWLKRNQGQAPPWIEDALRRMHQYIWSILAPDDNVPLLKDTAWDAAPHPLDLLAAGAVYFDEPALKRSEHFGLYPWLLFGAESCARFESWKIDRLQRNSVALPASGHYVMRDDETRDYLILDAGKTCADYLPAHGQADSLTYELSSAGKRLVVDSGVYEYTAGRWRDFFRSTRAHNTVEVAGENQSEVWSSFRVGRRAYPGPVHWHCDDDFVLVQAEHDGYARLSPPVIHQRTILWRKQSFWLIVDQLWGQGSTSSVNCVHLYPGLSLETIDEAVSRIAPSSTPLWLTTFGAASSAIARGQVDPVRQGWYSARFGELQANNVLELYQQGALPQCSGYVIARNQPARTEATKLPNGHQIKLTYEDFSGTLRLVRGRLPEFS